MENRQPLQAGSCSRAEGDRAKPPSVKAKPYDLLSFVSLFIHNTTEYSVALTLSNLNVDRLMTKAKQPKAGGSISAVTIIEVKDIEETLRRTSLSKELDGKEVIAFKRLVMKGSLNSARNKDLLNYVAVEYQVLRHKGLYNHPNILKLYGVSWMSAGIKDSLMLPVLILEAADHGDLASLLQKKEELTQIEKLFISMDIADGLWAMHECGIIHGDVKPDNILVFRHPGRKYLAKLSDFGSSVFLHDSPALNRLKTGTPLWQAPECLQLIESSQLARTDIYSLGMVIHDIFLNGLYSSIIKAMPPSEVQLMKDDDLIKLHAAQTQLLLAKGRAGSGIEEYDKEVHENLGLLLYTMLSKDPKDRTSSTREVLQRLRYIAKESVNNAIVAPILFPSGDQAKDLQAMTDINSWRFADDVLFYPELSSSQIVRPAFQEARLLASSESVIEVSASAGTMQHLSKAVREQIFDELGKTASSDPSNTRKREAAFELAYGIFSGFDERQPKTSDLALRHLVKAAMEGHELARSVIGSVHDAFGKDLPVPSEKELEWLVHATERGDLVSRSRLRTKAPALCDDALYRLRSPEAFAQDAIARIELGFDTAERMLWFSAGTGNLQLARFCLTTGDCVVDQENEFKETPLLQACRAGHLDVSRFLIENGAEVACADKEGTTPLHWLPSFPATEKDEAADLLVAAGAQLEARSYNARKVYGGHHRQHRLGSYDGTPLLWATVANDVSAVRALMRHGADPWDHGGSTQPTSGSWGNQIHYSPILYAADLHMAEILEIMCQPALDNCTLSNLLNTSYRELNGGSQVDHILPLHLAVGDLGLGRFQRIILHGASHREACSNTVNFLVKSGADAAKTDRQGVTAVQLASEVGSVDILQCLYQLRNGELKLQGKSLEKSLQVLIMMQRRQTFHFLLKVHAQDLQDAHLRSVLLVTAAEFCNDAFFAVSLLAAGPEKFSLDVSQVFEVAVDRGNFKLAQTLFEQYRYDPTTRRKGRSFLGLLVQKSKHSSVSLRALDYVLSLTDNSDEVFWAYEARFRDEVTRTSLLHAAVGANEFKDGIDRGTAALNLILRKFNLPKQLNAKMGGHGQTPLHVAIFCGNPEAVQTLIAEPGLDKKVLDNDGRSVLDLALLRLRNPDELLGFWNDIPSDRERNEHRMRLSSVAIIGMLLRAGFEGHRYTGRILRRSETYGELQQFVKKPSDMSTTVLGGTIDLRDRQNESSPNPVVEKLKAMKVGESRLFFSDAVIEEIVRDKKPHEYGKMSWKDLSSALGFNPSEIVETAATTSA